jgi:hypothetical protein
MFNRLAQKFFKRSPTTTREDEGTHENIKFERQRNENDNVVDGENHNDNSFNNCTSSPSQSPAHTGKKKLDPELALKQIIRQLLLKQRAIRVLSEKRPPLMSAFHPDSPEKLKRSYQ